MSASSSKSECTSGGAALSLSVRRAAAGDAAPLGFFFDAVLRRDYFLRRGQLESMLSSAHHQVWVAEIDTILVGAAITTRGSRLVNAIVHPAYRGLGIGKALLAASDAREVRAKIDMSSGDPRPFYEAAGFRRTGVRLGNGNIELMRRAGGAVERSAPSARAPKKARSR